MRSTWRRSSPTASRSWSPAERPRRRRGRRARGRRGRPDQPRHGDGRTARHDRGHRPGDRGRHRRLPRRARRPLLDRRARPDQRHRAGDDGGAARSTPALDRRRPWRPRSASPGGWPPSAGSRSASRCRRCSAARPEARSWRSRRPRLAALLSATAPRGRAGSALGARAWARPASPLAALAARPRDRVGCGSPRSTPARSTSPPGGRDRGRGLRNGRPAAGPAAWSGLGSQTPAGRLLVEAPEPVADLDIGAAVSAAGRLRAPAEFERGYLERLGIARVLSRALDRAPRWRRGGADRRPRPGPRRGPRARSRGHARPLGGAPARLRPRPGRPDRRGAPSTSSSARDSRTCSPSRARTSSCWRSWPRRCSAPLGVGLRARLVCDPRR